ncbi:multidrug efflux SMR transporter [Streptomyces malaysiensis subsp. malaysiensis]
MPSDPGGKWIIPSSNPGDRAVTGRRQRAAAREGISMAWLLVVVAGLLETGFAVCLKLSHGFTRLWPTIAFCVFALGSFGLLTLSLKKLDVGPAYAVWTGIGAAGTAIYGMIFLGDLVSTLKIISISLVIVGVIGLQLSGSAH